MRSTRDIDLLSFTENDVEIWSLRPPFEAHIPTLLSMPSPDVLTYPPETVMAEKLQAMIHLGLANSRMKDFYDLWILTNQFDFKGKVLQEAIRRTFQNRGTEIREDEPIAFSEDFTQEKQRQWTAFLKTDAVAETPDQLIPATNRIWEFVPPIFKAILDGKELRRNWAAKQGVEIRVPLFTQRYLIVNKCGRY